MCDIFVSSAIQTKNDLKSAIDDVANRIDCVCVCVMALNPQFALILSILRILCFTPFNANIDGATMQASFVYLLVSVQIH